MPVSTSITTCKRLQIAFLAVILLVTHCLRKSGICFVLPSLLDVHKLHWLLSCKTVILYYTVDFQLGKFIGVSILTCHVQQHCWYHTVGKFVHVHVSDNCLLVLKKGFVHVHCWLPCSQTFYVWQSRVEIEHYSVAYFGCITTLKHCSVELLLRAGLISHT